MVLIDGGGGGGVKKNHEIRGGSAYASITDSRHFDDWIMKL